LGQKIEILSKNRKTLQNYYVIAYQENATNYSK
jgi:hypothetical protein